MDKKRQCIEKVRWLLCLLLPLLIWGGALHAENEQGVLIIELEGPINPGTAMYATRGIDMAKDEGRPPSEENSQSRFYPINVCREIENTHSKTYSLKQPLAFTSRTYTVGHKNLNYYQPLKRRCGRHRFLGEK